MSRIGKKPINIPSGVTVDVSAHGTVTVKGPKGTLTQDVNPDIQVSVEGQGIILVRPTESKRHKSLHGLYRRFGIGRCRLQSLQPRANT